MLFALLALCVGSARADGTPDIAAAVSSSTTLYGDPVHVRVSATNPAAPYGYNLSFRVVLPEGISYAGGGPVAPRQVADRPNPGETTLIFSNVSDLSPNSTKEVGFDLLYSETLYDAGDTFNVIAHAFVNSDARFLPKFDADGNPEGPKADSFTGFTQQVSGTQTLKAIEVEIEEPSPEGEILRGVHDHQTVYTLKVTNNGVNPTTGTKLDAYVPAGLEFLGCGGAGADNTTNAPTNPGSAEEYAGSGPINVAPLAGCVEPESVQTELVDPDGPGPMPTGVYTHVVWPVGTLEDGETKLFPYRAAVPIRANTNTFTGARPSAASGNQATNLDNNSGAEVLDEALLRTYATAAGTYQGNGGPSPASDAKILDRTAEDWVVHKGGSSGTLAQGAITQWTLTFETSEYKFVDDATVTDTLPSGLCPLGPVNYTTQNTPDDSECAPVGGQEPSAPYASATENGDGTFTIVWNSGSLAKLGHTGVNDKFTIVFPTKTRVNYQQNFAASSPILTHDRIANSVETAGAGWARCTAPGSADCLTPGPKIDFDGVDGSTIVDASGAEQEAGGPVIAKQVAQSGTDCQAATYVNTVPRYHPGDRVCWRVRVDFPSALDTSPQALADYMPASVEYEMGSDAATPADNVIATVDETGADDGLLTWTVSGSVVPAGAQVFEHVFSTIALPPGTPKTGDLTGNLLKFSSVNTPGNSIPQRAEAEYAIDTPEVGLLKGVEKIVRGVTTVDGPNGPNVDNKPVQANDQVTYRVDVSNDGAQDAVKVEVWDILPADFDCAEVSAISDGGACVDDTPRDRVVWTVADIAAETAKKLTYTATVPSDIGPGRNLVNDAGVRQFAGETNLGGEFLYTPAENIDPDNATTPNAPPADNPSNVTTAAAAINKTRTTGVTETGNNVGSQATIGETITYTVTATVPEGTTLGGTAELTDALNTAARQAYVGGSATATLNGGALPGGFTLDTSGTAPKVVFPADYANAPGSGNDSVVLSFQVLVTDVAANLRGTSVANQAKLTYTDPATGVKTHDSPNVTTTIVEPLISQTKSDDVNPNRVDPGDIVQYTVTTTNSGAANVSTAHDVKIVDTLPAGLIPVDIAPTNTPIPDGGTIPGSGGAVWNATARTISKTVATLAPGANTGFSYRAEIAKPAIAGASLTNKVEATTASLAEAFSGRRTSGGGYKANAEDTIKIAGAAITKSVTPEKATIGESVTYELTMTIPANIELFDTTVFDALPDGILFDHFVSEQCVSGCPLINPVNRYWQVYPGDGTIHTTWDLGDIPALNQPQVIKFTYQGYVAKTSFFGEEVVAGQSLVNTAEIDSNRTNKFEFDQFNPPSPFGFDDRSAPAKATVTVAEPKVSIAKEIKVGNGGFTAGPTPAHSNDPLAYRLIVENSGDSPAYDVEVADLPDAALANVQLVPQAGVTVLDPWTTVDRKISWRIAGPIPVGGKVTLEYTADFVAASQLHDGQQVPNTAKVPHYFGVPKATRDANPSHGYRDYTDGGEDSTEAVLDFPQLELEKTTGLAGSPDTGGAEINQEFPWRIVVTNSSPTAGAKEVHVHDILPPNWSYESGSTTLTPGVPQEPSVNLISGSEQLQWTIPVLGPEESVVIAFRATPSLGAKTLPGTGPEANVNRAAVILASDEAGNTGNEDGPYESAPDDATATLEVPQLSVEKTPDGGAATAGEASSFTIEVDNEGDGVARNVKVKDVLPAGLGYDAGTATAIPPTGFSETAVGPGPGAGETTIEWAIASIPANSSVQIELPVNVAATAADGATLTNRAVVTSDEETTPIEDDGSLEIEREAELVMTKTGAPGYTAGENYTWHLRVQNLGPSEAEGATVSDPLPAGTSFVSASLPCEQAAIAVECDLGDLPVGFDQTYDVTVKVDPGTTTSPLSNTAEVEAETEDPNPANDEATFGPTAGSLADVWIEKSAAPTAILKQHEATFTITVHNDGPSVARNVEIDDPLPAGLVFVSADAACSEASNTVNCVIGDLAENAEQTIQITVRGTVNGVHQNTATVTTTTPEPTDHKPNSDEAEVEVLPVADLAIEKTAPATVPADGPLTWTLKVTNNGEDPATGVTIVDQLPAGVVFSSADAGCTLASGTVTCDVGALAVGESAERQITVTVPLALAETTISNSATVDGDQGDDEPGNDSDEASTTVDPAADVWIEKSVDLIAILKHHETTFTIVIHNDGPSVARNVEINDPLPAGLAFVSADDVACSEVSNTVNCVIGDLAANAERTVHVTVRGVLNGIHENVGTVTTTTSEPTGHKPNSDEAEVEVGPVADLALEKTGPATVVADGQLTWTLKATNNGEDPATGVKITDPLPAGTEFVSADAGCALAAATVTCDVGALAVGESAERQITVTVPRALADTTVVNSATVDGDQGDDEPGNDSDEAATKVGPSADVSIVKTGPARVNAGGTLTWTLAVANAGPSTATGVVVKDTLPAGVELRQATPTQGTCTGALECQLGTLPKGGAAQIQVVVHVPPALANSSLLNSATVTAQEPDPVLENNESKATTVVDPVAPSTYDLAIAKTVDGSAQPSVGDTVSYEIVVSNRGPATANGVKVVDALPASLEFVKATVPGGKCTQKDGVVTCEVASLAAGAELRVTVKARVMEEGTIANTATVSAAVADADPNNNKATAKIRATLHTTKLTVKKTRIGKGSVEAGERIRYRIRVANLGTGPAADVVVCDRLPSKLSFASLAGAQLERGDACWEIDLLAPGGSKTFRLAARVDGGVGGMARNVAYVKAENAPKGQGVAGVRVERAGPGRAGGVTG